MPASPPDDAFAPLAGLPVAHLRLRLADALARLDVTPEERGLTARMAPGRAGEFLAGRSLVREILRRRWPGRERGFSLLPDAERRPLWPPGIVGSITHSGGWVAAALAEAGEVHGIGIDLQEVPDPGVAQETAPVVARREIARGLGLPLPQAVALVLSCKESLYKCVNPRLDRFIDFEDVEAVLDIERGEARFVRHAAGPALPEPPLPCRFVLRNGWVESAVLWPGPHPKPAIPGCSD